MDNKDKEFVARKFLDSLIYPKEKPSKQIFFCPVGLVGAGKTTFTKPISEKLNLVRVSSDEMRKILKESGFGYSNLKEIILPIATDLINSGWSIAFDMDCGNIETKAFIDKISLEKNIRVIWVHVKSPEEYIFDKFKKHPPTWLSDNPQKMIDNYFAQKEKREKEGTKFNFDFTFDASQNVTEQVNLFFKSNTF